MSLTIDEVVSKVLVAIYSQEILSDKLYLKGGQALRLTQNIRGRLSRDSDFSTPEKINDEEIFFNLLEESVRAEFHKVGLYVIGFKFSRKPRIKPEGAPDFWQGWGVEFKIIEKSQLKLSKERQSAVAITPEGSESNTILIDISEMEYCGSFEKVKVKSVEVRVYSRVLLVLEKLRAICQSHQDYKYRSKRSNRARDFYDIERIYSKVLGENKVESFIDESVQHLEKVFSAKDVPLDLINRCLTEDDFLQIQKIGWQEVESTVQNLNQDFSYYLQTLKDIVSSIRARRRLPGL